MLDRILKFVFIHFPRVWNAYVAARSFVIASVTSFVTSDKWRGLEFAIVSAALLYVVFGFKLQETAPGVQMTLYNLAVVSIRATLGYWIARKVLGRIYRVDPDERDPDEIVRQKRAESSGSEFIARAILVAAVILTSR